MKDKAQPSRAKLVLVEWRDSQASMAVWETCDEMDDLAPLKCVSVGFVLEDTEDRLVLAMTRNDYQVMGRVVIPREAITAVKSLG